MGKGKMIIFKPYPMEVGQKIHIDGGPRGGDWQVIDVSERKVRLRCPVTRKEVDWDRFCYFVEDAKGIRWPQND